MARDSRGRRGGHTQQRGRIPAQRTFEDGDLVRAQPVTFDDDADWVTGRLRVVRSEPDDAWSFDMVWPSDGTADEPVVVDSSTIEPVPSRLPGKVPEQGSRW